MAVSTALCLRRPGIISNGTRRSAARAVAMVRPDNAHFALPGAEGALVAICRLALL